MSRTYRLGRDVPERHPHREYALNRGVITKLPENRKHQIDACEGCSYCHYKTDKWHASKAGIDIKYKTIVE